MGDAQKKSQIRLYEEQTRGEQKRRSFSGENVRDVWRGTEFARQRVISEGIGREERHRRNKRRGGLIRQQI